MLVAFLLYHLFFNTFHIIYAGSCCDRTRSGYIEINALVEFLHDPEIIENQFIYNNATDDYYIDMTATIEFRRNHYFLDNFYEPYENRSKVCFYKLLNQEGEEVHHLVFSDGSRPKQFVFGCHSDQECCGVGCCTINKYIYFWFMYPVVSMMVLLAYTFRRKRDTEARLRRVQRQMNEP